MSTSYTTNVSLYLPSSQPASAQALDPNLASFSIEMDHWPDWAGEEIGKANDYVLTLLSNLEQRTGSPQWLRVGGE